MALPDSRNRTYVDGVTQIPAGDMNQLQDDDVLLSSAQLGSALLVVDDFTGSALSTGIWNSPTGSLVDDTASGGCGTVQLSDSGGGAQAFSTNNLKIGTSDFRLAARIRVVSMGGASSLITLQMQYSSAAGALQFFARGGGTNWQAVVDGGADHDTGVAFGTTYQKLEIRRVSGVVTFYIDGTSVYSTTPAPQSIDGLVGCYAIRVTSGTTTARIDYVKLRAVTGR